jgi:hypothetical protein
MKKMMLSLLVCAVLADFNEILAQSNWVTGGNSLAANASIGSNTNFSVILETNNLERARLTNAGLFGIGTTTPAGKLHVNSAAGAESFRAQVNGSTKLLVNGSGGVSVGSGTFGPVNGLYVAGNTGLGTASPENKVHIFKGSAGTVTGYVNAPLIVENSTHNYINLLAPSSAESGMLFGDPVSNVNGGIIYNSELTNLGFQFRTNNNVTRMVLSSRGNLGVGLTDPGVYRIKLKPDNTTLGLDIEDALSNDDWELRTDAELELRFNSAFKGLFNTTSGAYETNSDRRLKENIKPLSSVIEKIRQLQPSSYQFRNGSDQKEHYGFIAQDVLNIFPGIVTHKTGKTGNLDQYTMDYSGFGVIAIKGIQELLPIIEQQDLKITALEERLKTLENTVANMMELKKTTSGKPLTSAELQQNQPNPFNGRSTISYTLPKGRKGEIKLFDQGGNLVKNAVATNSGKYVLDGHDLQSGTYTYSLVVDGKVEASRKLIVIR